MHRLQRIQLLRVWPLMAGGTITIGTRGSQLALWQANWVKEAVNRHHPDLTVDLVIIKTKGDKILDVPLAKVGGKGLFVKEIEEALLDGRIDLAVHSMKDMPADIPGGLCIGAIPEREEPRDVLITRSGLPLDRLEQGARIGTSSLRRSAQLLRVRPDISIFPLRGNLDTRLKKLESESMDAIVLAAAGVRRLGLADRITQILDETIMLPAVGQGALCIEIRENDSRIEPVVAALDDLSTRQVVMGERAFLSRLEGGCQVPIAGHGHIDERGYTLTGLVCDVDGSHQVKQSKSGPEAQSEKIGLQLAEALLALGAGDILERLNANA
ncbi:hydroxymethylbilane synthase [Desulfosarcina sp.]|uniref:hydroxymethylbilane synthase n=1 Tax=Desulfosarcina sp. TaxID=2027861 RepID=UPI0029A32F0F|nr:hydroxymethylbilane synthase [Desulfosarcina sp.]MDX2452978.1 hydroxymethylbilane synthase [Desulfosarcina sp.]MDX2490713.1 hydroxymethylbilane synthase [Desulfosarcina sp.]